MSDLQRYVNKRKKRDKSFRKGFGIGYEDFKIGVALKEARKDAGLTQEQLAKMIKTKKSAISRVENHAADIRLSTLQKIATALGKELFVRVA